MWFVISVIVLVVVRQSVECATTASDLLDLSNFTDSSLLSTNELIDYRNGSDYRAAMLEYQEPRTFGLFDVMPPIAKVMESVPGMIRSHGYPVEVHQVTTPDGYILQMHRIPNNRKFNVFERKRAVLMVHGFASQSGAWVIIGPNRSLAYLLADQGYDVWLANCRGNIYSRRHVRLDPHYFDDSVEYWNFSFHQVGVYDLPSMIDYILAVNTAFPTLHYIGHGQGTTAFFVMASKRPQYNYKIQLMQAFAPIAFLEGAGNYLISIGRHLDNLNNVLPEITKFEFLGNIPLTSDILSDLCRVKLLAQILCGNYLFLSSGYNPDLLDEEMMPMVFKHVPAGGSSVQLMHYGQIKKTGRFAQFDFGPEENFQRYGTPISNNYPLHRISAPVVLHYSMNDFFSSKRGVLRLQSKLSNSYLNEIKDTTFNHIDYIWGKRVERILYDFVLELIHRSDTGERIVL